MTVIYMVHPAHGAKVAISNEEAILDAFDGWERYDVVTSSRWRHQSGADAPAQSRKTDQ
jgi:hypothetical protein